MGMKRLEPLRSVRQISNGYITRDWSMKGGMLSSAECYSAECPPPVRETGVGNESLRGAMKELKR
jgi:hypothetical protein